MKLIRYHLVNLTFIKIGFPFICSFKKYIKMKLNVFDIEVKTADKLWAGTDDTVQISMSGPISGLTKNTGMITLHNKGVNDHERGDLCKFEIDYCRYQFEEIESLTVLKNGRDDWNLEWIKVIVSNHTDTMTGPVVDLSI